jgi:GTP-binding protein Era
MSNEFRSGCVAVIGRPNVGKSSLLNSILQFKLSIVSPKPQTTRDNILGIYNSDSCQIVFVDTPGIHKPHSLLGEKLVERASDELNDADVILYVVTIDDRAEQSENQRIIDKLNTFRNAVIVLAVNKVDLSGSKTKILPLIDEFSKKLKIAAAVPVSARSNVNIDMLLQVIENLLPVSAPLYPDDMVTDRSERFIAQEIIRENIISQTDEEVPHSVAVEVTEYKSPAEYPERKDLLIRANIYVEREGQKAIILGRNGKKIKAIGTAARKILEEMTGHKVYLELWVKVSRGWRDSESELKKLGYQ